MTIDIDRARAETPGCAHVAHLMACGAGLMPAPVLEALKDHLDLEATIGGYEAAARAEPAVERTYDAIAEMLNCHRDEVAVMENATVAWQMAFLSLPFQPGDRILTAVSEYASNYIAFLQLARRVGVTVDVVPNDEHGQLDVARLAGMIDERVKLIAVTHVPTNGGLVNPAEAIGKVARDAGVPYLLDACQSVGQMPIDVAAIGCDFLSATGRKYLRGPRGTGFLYARRAILDKVEPPILDLHSASWTAPDRFEMEPSARRFENWENYVAGKIGLGVAVDYAMEWGLAEIEAYVAPLAEHFRDEIRALPGGRVHDLGERRCGIVGFSLDGVEPDTAIAAAAAEKINISRSHVTSTRLDMQPRDLELINRVGLHYYNTEEEVDRLVKLLAKLP
ncbi:MAG: aminotransferase class V-fold PLP-dependent enzyme [Alphaproteobacteria bacterium]